MVKITIHIQRYRPGIDSAPKIDTYVLDVSPKDTLLSVLLRIQNEYDPSLAISYSCRRGVCGSCTVLVNGIPMLACQTTIENILNLFGNSITVEPLKSFRIVRDLVTDHRKMWNLFQASRPWIYRTTPYIAPEIMKHNEAKIVQDYKKCISCFACMENCPVYRIASIKFRGPYIFRLHSRFHLDPRDQLNRVYIAVEDGLYLCLLCGACNAVCPQEIDVEESIVRLRISAYSSNLLPARLADALESVKDPQFSNPLWLPREDRAKWLEGISYSAQADVLIYAGCMASYADNDSVKALAEVLEHAGIKFTVLGEEENCCGMPLYLAGDIQGLTEIAKKNLEIILRSRPKIIVTPCPSCYRMLVQIYPRILGINWKANGIEILHSTQYLLSLLERGVLKVVKPINMAVTYHDPCDLGRHLGIYDVPRRILSIIGTRLIEMRYRGKYAQCCGAGGNLRITDPVLSLKIAQRRLEHIPNGINVVMHACPTCKIQFIDACKQASKSIKNVSIQELVLKVIG